MVKIIHEVNYSLPLAARLCGEEGRKEKEIRKEGGRRYI
jgi:hypothetical protein